MDPIGRGGSQSAQSYQAALAHKMMQNARRPKKYTIMDLVNDILRDSDDEEELELARELKDLSARGMELRDNSNKYMDMMLNKSWGSDEERAQNSSDIKSLNVEWGELNVRINEIKDRLLEKRDIEEKSEMEEDKTPLGISKIITEDIRTNNGLRFDEEGY